MFLVLTGLVLFVAGIVNAGFALVGAVLILVGALHGRGQFVPPPVGAPAGAVSGAAAVAIPHGAVRGGAELEVGRKLLPVVGVFLLFLGLALFISFLYPSLTPGGKILLTYVAAAVLFGVAVGTRRRFVFFANVVLAGAWAVTYFTTYATGFVSATRIIESPLLVLFLLSIVVAALLALAVGTRSRWLVAYGLVLGFLTGILSPLSLFSLGTAVLLLVVSLILMIVLPWDVVLLPTSLGAYITFLVWFIDVGGKYPVQGGGLLEKNFLGLVVATLLWVLSAAGVLFRRGTESRPDHPDATVAILAATTLTTFFGLVSLRELAPASARLVSGVYLLALAGFHAGWGILLPGRVRRTPLPAIAAVASTLFLLGGVGQLLPAGSAALSVVWAGLGIALLATALLRAPLAGPLVVLPLSASALRFFTNDLEVSNVINDVLPLRLVVGLVLALLFGGGALAARPLGKLLPGVGRRLPGYLLSLTLLVLFAVSHREFPGAVPTILWGVLGLLVIGGGFFGRWTDARLVGLVALGASVLRIFLHDLAGLDPLPRVFSFVILGATLLLVGYAYNHNRERLQRFLEES